MEGYSVFELTAALLLMAVASAVMVPAGASHRDRIRVLTAREFVVSAIQETRTEAVRAGGASLVLNAPDARGRIMVGDSMIRAFRLDPVGRVDLVLGRGRRETEIDFGGLGLGLFANETLELMAGDARTRLVISSYGRVRRE